MYSKYTKVYKAIPRFFRLESNEFPDIGSVGRIKKKKIHQKSRNRRSWYPRMTLKVNIYIFGLGKMHNLLYKMFLFFSVQLLCSFFRLKELFQVKNGSTTSFHRPFFSFFETAKNLGRSYDGERRKKRRWPNANLLHRDFQ